MTVSHYFIPMARSDRKQREYEQREQDILNAALALCSGPDWASVTVDQIAAQADVSKGTVYTHFSSKDELLFRLLMRFFAGLLHELQEIQPEGEVADQFRAIFRHALEYHVRHMEYRYIVLYCERADFKERANPEWRDDFMTLDRSFDEWGRTHIVSAMEHGEFESREPEKVMLGIHSTFKGAIHMLWTDDHWCSLSTNTEEFIGAITDFIVAALVGSASGINPGD